MVVLVNAYACSPNMGSEPGMAWNWCIHLAKHCELHIITEGEFKEQIESALPALPQGRNMHFYYNPVPANIRKMCWDQGDWRFYRYYKAWQYKTYEMALNIMRTHHIDIVHQLNMIGFREPGYLWKIQHKPFIWGPVDARSKFPTAYLKGASLRIKLVTHLKNLLNDIQLRYAKRVRRAVQHASVVISASSNAQQTFRRYFGITSPLINETGCTIHKHPLQDKLSKKNFDVLWVGKPDFRKQLGLAIRSVAETKNAAIRLHIIGGGDDKAYRALASHLNISALCIWHGKLDHGIVQELMRRSDLFLFTSVAEGTPHVVLEAISNDLPVLCFDTCGQGDVVNETVGSKIALSDPGRSATDLAHEMNYLYSHRAELKKMSENCGARQQELSWDVKARSMVDHYRKISGGN
ncbi:MAG TPA: glycosyltransferase family 4 protein [Phnomibacter sp.]|nr:glycosyltransferase family 4 protein [Phnomibacter sp.]